MLEHVKDDSGYVVRVEDLNLVAVSPEDFNEMARRQRPLGVDGEVLPDFIKTLSDALAADGIDDAEVYIRGSSAQFFAGTHKEMAYETVDLLRACKEEDGTRPKGQSRTKVLPEHTAYIERKLSEHWPDAHSRPRRRIFDLYYRLGISRDPSDVDIEIRSDLIASRIHQHINDEYPTLPKKEALALVTSAKYGFFDKSDVLMLFSHLTNWMDQIHRWIHREATIACFPKTGYQSPQQSPSCNLDAFRVDVI